MYYKLTMKDKRVVFVTSEDLSQRISVLRPCEIRIWGRNFADRLTQIQVAYPDCIDWEMVENEEAPLPYKRSESQKSGPMWSV